MELDPQYADWSDEALADHLNRILAEQERRQRLATIPDTIKSLAAQYIQGGGDPADLTLESARSPQTVHDEPSADMSAQPAEARNPAEVG